MNRKQIPLFDVTLSAATRRLVDRTLASGWLSSGPAVRAFEDALAKRMNVPYAAAVNSATAGLILALRAANIRPGQEVITTPLTFIATIEAIFHVGAIPVLADIDPYSLTLDPLAVASRITRRTSAILTVDLAGHPCDYRAFRRLCREHGLHLIADSAHAIGTRYRGKPIPCWSDLSVLSFYATKNLTCGEGGMVLSRSRSRIEKVRTLARHGLTSNAFLRRHSGSWSYDAVDLGYKANLSDIHAAVGLGQLRELDRHQGQRAALAARYFRNLSGFSDLIHLPALPDNGVHGWHLFIVRLVAGKNPKGRNDLIRRMARDGIECGVHYRPVYEFSYYHALRAERKRLPVTTGVAGSLITLPLYPAMTTSDIDHVCERLLTTLRHISLR
jgi:perosamine synthetase